MIMKRFILVAAVMMVCVFASAQVGMVRSTGGSVGRIKHELKKYPAEKGLQQEVQLSAVGLIGGGWHRMTGLVDYVIGKRINNWVFAGAGIGVHLYEMRGQVVFEKSRYQYKDVGTSLDLPIYAHAKVYFTDTRVKPFFATSAGLRFGFNANQTYQDYGAYFNAGLGFSAYLTEKLDLTFTVGYQLWQEHWQKIYDANDVREDSDVSSGMNMHIGLSF